MMFYYYCKLTIIRNNLILWYFSDKMICGNYSNLVTKSKHPVCR